MNDSMVGLIDVSAADVEAAKTFYSALFGWTYRLDLDPSGSYTYADLEGTPHADLPGINLLTRVAQGSLHGVRNPPKNRARPDGSRTLPWGRVCSQRGNHRLDAPRENVRTNMSVNSSSLQTRSPKATGA